MRRETKWYVTSKEYEIIADMLDLIDDMYFNQVVVEADDRHDVISAIRADIRVLLEDINRNDRIEED